MVVVLVVTVLYMEMVGVVGKYVTNALALEERGCFVTFHLKYHCYMCKCVGASLVMELEQFHVQHVLV